MYENLFICTPTHICKRYAAKQLVTAVLRYAPGAHFIVVANSTGNPEPYYRAPGVHFVHLKLDETHYNYPDSIHKRITASMNHGRDLFLGSRKFTHFLSLESDVLINAATIPDMLMAIEEPNVHVVHSNCYPGFHKETEVTQVGRVTLGCTLIKREVLELLPFRYDERLLAAHHDAFFAADCNEAGFNIFYHPEIRVEHMHDYVGQRGWGDLPLSEIA